MDILFVTGDVRSCTQGVKIRGIDQGESVFQSLLFVFFFGERRVRESRTGLCAGPSQKEDPASNKTNLRNPCPRKPYLEALDACLEHCVLYEEGDGR